VSTADTIVPVPEGPLVLQNTSPRFCPDIAWGTGARDGCLVLSNSPESLDDSVMQGPVGTLYQDLSASSQLGPSPSPRFIAGDLRVFVFHTNRTTRRLDIGFTVRNASPAAGTLTWYRRSGQGQSRAAVKLAQALAFKQLGHDEVNRLALSFCHCEAARRTRQARCRRRDSFPHVAASRLLGAGLAFGPSQ
jgi:hypothetical protein